MLRLVYYDSQSTFGKLLKKDKSVKHYKDPQACVTELYKMPHVLSIKCIDYLLKKYIKLHQKSALEIAMF